MSRSRREGDRWIMEPWDGGRVELLILGVDLLVTVTDRDNKMATAVLSPDEADDLSTLIQQAITAD
jgi:hypothetical protein